MDRKMQNELFADLIHQYGNIPGVYFIDCGVGPTIGFTIHTHGNEPAGLAVYRLFRYEWPLWEHLKGGRVFFVINNLEAARFYHAIPDLFEDSLLRADQERQARFLNRNLNRLPDDLQSDEGNSQYEVRRARELQPVWQQFDYALDIHSTESESEPMIIALRRTNLEYLKGFPISDIIVGVEAVQYGVPACAYYGAEKSVIAGIEAGSHQDALTFAIAQECAMRFLVNIGVLEKDALPNPVAREHTKYGFFGALRFPNSSFELVRVIRNKESLHPNEVLARGRVEGKEVTLYAPDRPCLAFFPPKGRKNSKWDEEEEIMFFSEAGEPI